MKKELLIWNLPTVAAIVLLACSGCGKKSTDPDSSIGDTVEAAVNNLSGTADDASNGSMAAIKTPSKAERILDELFTEQSAFAGIACDRTLTGSAGACTRTVDCSFGPYSWTGSVALTFSNGTSCTNPSIAAVGDSFTRVPNFTRSGPRGSIQTIANAHTDYNGDSISGGTTVTRATGGGLSVMVNGVSKVLEDSAGTSLVDVSFKSDQALSLNQLARNGRVLNGSLDVIHNLAKFTAVHTYKALTWGDGSCCYPTSGEIDIALSGSITGTATVTFNGCGSAAVTYNGSSAQLSLENCE